MKILFLNPFINASHKIIETLRSKGHALLMPSDPAEAWQVLQLHKGSVELLVIHREGQKGVDGEEPGIKFLNRVKNDNGTADLPLIFTSSFWNDEDFAKHQMTPTGANGYLRFPYDPATLLSLIDTIMTSDTGTRSIDRPITSVPIPNLTQAVVLNSAPSLFSQGTSASTVTADSESGMIQLEEVDPQAGNPTANPAALSEILAQLSAEPPAAAPELDALSPIQIELESDQSGPRPTLETGAPSGTAATVALSTEETKPPPLPFAVPDAPSIPAVRPPAFQSAAAPVASDPQPVLQIDAQPVSSPEAPPIHVGAIPIQDLSESETRINIGDPESYEKMPYLFKNDRVEQVESPVGFEEPLDDAVVPGGAVHSPDMETLKKYLLLREQDVAVLSTQLRAAKERMKELETFMREEKARSAELSHCVSEQKRKIEELESDRSHQNQELESETSELRFQLKVKADKARILEGQVREANDEIERLKERVRTDIRKIRVREKDLENKLEILKKDSEAVLVSREQKIIELKRKLDLVEFNMDLLQNQLTNERQASAKQRERIQQAAQAIRVAGGLLGLAPTPAEENPNPGVVQKEDQKAS